MTTIATDADRSRLGRAAWEGFLVNGGIVMTLLIVTVAATVLIEPRFVNQLNLLNVMRNFAFLAIPAMAQMLVMTTGGFDLSLGAVLAAGSVVTALVMQALGAALPGAEGAAILAAIVATLALGAAIGLVNGLLVAWFDISAFMVTLAVGSIITGVVLYFTQGIPIYGVVDGFVDVVGRGRIGPVPNVMLLALLVVAFCVTMQRTTLFGRHLYAVGSEPRAARLSGVPTLRTVVSAYALAGMLAALTGGLMTARIGSGQGTIGGTLALETIAAAVIGGVSLRGGIARAELVAAAALFLTVVANAMNMLRIDSRWQALVLGLVLIVALSVERLFLRGRSE